MKKLSKQGAQVWRAYSGKLAWPTLAMTVGLLGATLGLQALAIAGAVPLWLASALLVPVAYLWFTPLHEAVHGNIGGSRARVWVDTAVGWIAALAFVAPYPAFQAVHLRHHGTVNKAGRDPDLWVKGSGPVSVAARCLSIVPHYYWKFGVEMRNESVAMRRAVLQAAVAVTVVVAVSAGLVVAGFGVELLALWVLPGWLASGMLAFAFDWLPHHPHTDTGRFTNARVLEGGPVLTWLMVAQDAHLVHHLWPKVPFYRYHAVLRATRSELEGLGVRFDDRIARRDAIEHRTPTA